jgi:hypothetical protein
MPETLKTTGVAEVAPKRKFARDLNPEPAEPVVRCRVTRRGADKISTGRHEPMLGDETYAEGEIVDLALSIAREQQDAIDAAGQPRGYVEILS